MKKFLAIPFVAVALAACGGGGGGGPQLSTSGPTQAEVNSVVSDYHSGYREVAQAAGVTGKGVTLTVVDDFVDVYEGTHDVTHGGTVSHIASSIATGSTVHHVHIDLANSPTDAVLPTASQMAKEINKLIQQNSIGTNQVINMSFTLNGQFNYANEVGKRLQELTSNQVAVIAAGNDSCTNTSTASCNVFADAFDVANVNKVLVVGAIEGENGVLATYSNKPGKIVDLQENWVVADGNLTAEHTDIQGTSFAAPRVAATVALVTEKFNTTAEKAALIILDTADNSGIYSDATKYGKGRLDVRAALSPVGTIK